MVDYIEKIQHQGQTSQNIDSPSFHGNWVHNPLCLGWPIRMDSGVRYTYSLEDYLPNDGHNYEIMVYFYVNTNTAQHSTQYCWVTSGGKDGNYWINTRVGGVVTRVANYTDSDCSWTSIPILSNNRYVSFWQDGSHTSGENWVAVLGYRKLGNNNLSDITKVSNIKSSDNKTLYFNGFDGKWKYVGIELCNAYRIEPARKTVYVADLSGILPNDDYDYECLVDITHSTSGSGWSATQMTCFGGVDNFWTLQSVCDKGNGTSCNCTSIKVPILKHRRELRITSDPNTTTSACVIDVRLEGYRRLGRHV